MAFLKLSSEQEIKIKNLLKAFFIIVFIPNILLIITTQYLNVSRTFINVDYFIPILLLAFRKKITTILGIILFSLFYLIDLAVIANRFTPDLSISDLIYLAGFLFQGPVAYKYLVCLGIILLIFELILICKLVKLSSLKNYFQVIIYILSFKLFLLLLYFVLNNFIIHNNEYTYQFSAERNISSPFIYYLNHNVFSKAKKLTPIASFVATDPWHNSLNQNEPLNDKLLLVIAESWGLPKDSLVQQEILENLLEQSSQYDYFEQGNFKTIGVTATGEIRELCKLHLHSLRFLASTITGFENCLPNQLKKQDYNIVYLHGNKSILYDRMHWYPLAGLDKIYFGEDIGLPFNNRAETAPLDTDLLPFVAKQFKENDKLFLYWMTFTSHIPYYKADIKNKRLSCDKHNIQSDTEACRNLMMHAQFFDNLAKLIQQPAMKGVEVIVVGDHTPPFIYPAESQNYFVKDYVPWLHFKINN